jgi:hypothetical protein
VRPDLVERQAPSDGHLGYFNGGGPQVTNGGGGRNVGVMPQLPSGTVTFMFTDIEGSTRLWEAHPEAMRVALARHDAVVREAVESAGGYVFSAPGNFRLRLRGKCEFARPRSPRGLFT